MKTSRTSSESKTPAVALAPAGFPIVGIGASAGGLEKARKELAATKISEDAVSEYSDSVINTVREPLIVLNMLYTVRIAA